MTGRLGEVPEAEAVGEVAALYDDIRRVTGVSTVPLIYRALAQEPHILGSIWADLAPNLGDPDVRRAAARLGTSAAPRIARLPATVAVDRERAAVTLAMFDRVNRLNVVGLTALLEGVESPIATAQPATAPDPLSGGLEMADLGTLSTGVLALLQEMSRPVTGGGTPIVIPSVYRYFANDQALLSALWSCLRSFVESDDFGVSVAALRSEAGTIAPAFPYRVQRIDAEPARTIVERFVVTIPSMIVVTGLIRAALRL